MQKGTVILPKGGEFPKDALEVWEVLPGGFFRASPIGGGDIYRFGPAQKKKYGFHAASPEELQPKWYKAKFSMTSLLDEHPGWTLGDRWNGWATPHFEFETVKKILDDMVAMTKAENAEWIDGYTYDPDEDAFVIRETANPEQPFVVKGQSVGVGPAAGGAPRQLKLYPLGAWAWTWTEEKKRSRKFE